jgi:hypothetical protein
MYPRSHTGSPGRSIKWDLSGAALTIWITRHWSADEVICAAVDVLRRSPHVPPPRNILIPSSTRAVRTSPNTRDLGAQGRTRIDSPIASADGPFTT